MTATPLQIVWFKRDIRVTDHRPLARAAAAGPVLPLYVVEPDYWCLPDTSERQYLFLREGLLELDENLRALGQGLVVRRGHVVDVLADMHKQFGVSALWSHQETGNGWTFARDIAVGNWCRDHNVPWHEERQDGVIRRLKSREGWAGKWDRFMAEPVTPPPERLAPLSNVSAGDIPTASDLGLKPDRCTARQVGGRRPALQLLDSFLVERGAPYQRAMSSPISAATACSRLSPYIAMGNVSQREVAQATWTRQRALKQAEGPGVTGWRRSLSSFSGRLHWRCHFMQKLEDEPRLEFENLHPAYDGLRDQAADNPLFNAWATGQTGYPFLDACMRSLVATGWINFRMRAMLMAVASYHLWLDWRHTGAHLARMFTDYEPGIHWSQVQMQSGTTGINAIRVYNPLKQAYTQDPKGAFVRRWLPELAAVPDDFIHEPWTWGQFDAVVSDAYPRPVFDHEHRARVAKDRIWKVRRSLGHRETSKKIAHKHGSRKSGMRHTGNRGRGQRKGAPTARRKTTPKTTAQLSLFD